MTDPAFSVGIEEEYLLVDPDTRDLIEDAPAGMLPECERLLEDQVTPEFVQSQIEVGTRVCVTMDDARTDLTRLRQTVAQVARDHGAIMIAASTHPFASATAQKTTHKQH
jgi:carboxylate-amine ligase